MEQEEIEIMFLFCCPNRNENKYITHHAKERSDCQSFQYNKLLYTDNPQKLFNLWRIQMIVGNICKLFSFIDLTGIYSIEYQVV